MDTLTQEMHKASEVEFAYNDDQRNSSLKVADLNQVDVEVFKNTAKDSERNGSPNHKANEVMIEKQNDNLVAELSLKPTEVQCKHTCFVNVDDEQAILRINERLFKKYNIELNCCRTGAEFYALIHAMHRDEWFLNKTVLAVMDYKLDGEWGDEIIGLAKQLIVVLGCRFNLKFVALSSTEDIHVKKKFESQGILKLFPKPSKKSYIDEMISFIK